MSKSSRKSNVVRQLYQIWERDKTREYQEWLLEWFAANKRDLPWRRDPDPYRVWVSEIMLQQTQVQTVLPYYEKFLVRFPDLRSLARAPEEEVVAAWAGLGYYGRARNLRAAARIIVEKHGGRFPGELKAVLSLPGIGPYTAGAILSIAFNEPQPVVDGNVRRVMSRLHGIARGAPESFFWRQAEAWIPDGRASEFNQAAMELGALVCTPSAPRCPICPVSALCLARRRGMQNRIPRPRAMRAPETVRLVMLVLELKGKLLLVRRHDPAFIPGEWGLPTRLVPRSNSPSAIAGSLAKDIVGRELNLSGPRAVRHGITYRRIEIDVFTCTLGKVPVRLSGNRNGRWVPLSQIARFLTSSAFRKALHAVYP